MQGLSPSIGMEQEYDMTRLAVDVVLLPDERMTLRAIEMNRQVVRGAPGEIVLDRESCLPHVSLAMGCIERHNIGAIHAILQRLAGESNVRQLTATGICTTTNARGEVISAVEIAESGQLQTLHERVMAELTPFFARDATAEMFCTNDVAPSSLDWVRTYPQKAAYERFSPHITLGYGVVKPVLAFPTVFAGERLALCHLGNHCTCRRILAACELSGR